MLPSILLAVATFALTSTAKALHNSNVLQRDEGDTFEFEGAGGTKYYGLIQSQTDGDDLYSIDEGQRAWDDALNSIAQNLATADFASQTDLLDGNTIIVTGNMAGNEDWEDIGDSTEWGSIIDELQLKTIQNDNPEYMLVSIGDEEGFETFFATISLSWINTADD